MEGRVSFYRLEFCTPTERYIENNVGQCDGLPIGAPRALCSFQLVSALVNNASLEALHGVRGHKEANWANWAGKSMNHQRGPAACTSKNIYYYDIHALIAFALGGHICHRDTCFGYLGTFNLLCHQLFCCCSISQTSNNGSTGKGAR